MHSRFNIGSSRIIWCGLWHVFPITLLATALIQVDSLTVRTAIKCMASTVAGTIIILCTLKARFTPPLSKQISGRTHLHLFNRPIRYAGQKLNPVLLFIWCLRFTLYMFGSCRKNEQRYVLWWSFFVFGGLGLFLNGGQGLTVGFK